MSGEGCHNPKVKWQTLWNIPQLERLAKSCHRLDEIRNESETHRAGCGPVSKGVCLSVCLEVYTAAPNTALLSTLLPLLDVPHLRCSLLRHLQASPLLASLSLSLSAQSPIPLSSWTISLNMYVLLCLIWILLLSRHCGSPVMAFSLDETAGFLHLSPYL